MPDIMQEKPLNELLSRSMVDIYVGPSNTHWTLHEKLLCHHSPFFRRIFYKKGTTTTSYGLPDEEDHPFKTFIGWLYASSLPVPREEADLAVLLDLYLMAEKFECPALIADVLQVVREWYKYSDTYPGLRRVQYIYANTEDGSPMRYMLVHAVARMLLLDDTIKPHWDKALRKNGQLAVDIIRAMQEWRLEEEMLPDAREEPELGEELVDVEGELREQQRELDEEEGEEVDGGTEDEALDDSETTVVGSPVEARKLALKRPEFKRGKSSRASGLGGFKKLGLEDGFKQMANGLASGDYGTLH